MQDDLNRLSLAMDAREYRVDEPDGSAVSDEKVQAALAGLAAQGARPKPTPLGEMKWKLTTLILPSVMLVFVALYVTSLSAGVEPEFALLRAGGASVVLAVLGRAAVSILGDDSRLILNDTQIVAMAQNGAVREYLSGADAEHDSDGAEQPSTAAQAAGAGGKE
jgi:hypothetical protein